MAVLKVFAGIIGLVWKLYILIVFTLTALLFYPLITPLLTTTKNKKRAAKLFVWWSRVFRVLTFYPIKRVANAKLPDGPFIIVANHASYLDIFLMPSLFSRTPILFLGKAELLSYPLIKTYFENLHIPVFRGNRLKAAKSVVKAKNEIKEGWSIVIFPEGGIHDGPKPDLAPFKRGAFQIAKSAGVPIVPVTFLNNFQLFSDPTEILGLAGPGISKVIIHPFINVDEINEMEVEELRERCFTIINNSLIERYPHLK